MSKRAAEKAPVGQSRDGLRMLRQPSPGADMLRHTPRRGLAIAGRQHLNRMNDPEIGRE
jgi:hypothetical protein